MSVIGKLITLLRSSTREIGEALVDSNAIRICEQEIHDARLSIDQAKSELASLTAQSIRSSRLIEQLRSEIERYENLAVEAMSKSQEALTDEVATKVCSLESELEQQIRGLDHLNQQIERMKELIRHSGTQVRDLERELAIAKTTESVHKATQSVSGSLGTSGSRFHKARESLNRIKQRHEQQVDRMAAHTLLDDTPQADSLEQRLAAAGIGTGPDRKQEVMDRLRTKHSNASK